MALGAQCFPPQARPSNIPPGGEQQCILHIAPSLSCRYCRQMASGALCCQPASHTLRPSLKHHTTKQPSAVLSTHDWCHQARNAWPPLTTSHDKKQLSTTHMAGGIRCNMLIATNQALNQALLQAAFSTAHGRRHQEHFAYSHKPGSQASLQAAFINTAHGRWHQVHNAYSHRLGPHASLQAAFSTAHGRWHQVHHVYSCRLGPRASLQAAFSTAQVHMVTCRWHQVHHAYSRRLGSQASLRAAIISSAQYICTSALRSFQPQASMLQHLIPSTLMDGQHCYRSRIGTLSFATWQAKGWLMSKHIVCIQQITAKSSCQHRSEASKSSFLEN